MNASSTFLSEAKLKRSLKWEQYKHKSNVRKLWTMVNVSLNQREHNHLEIGVQLHNFKQIQTKSVERVFELQTLFTHELQMLIVSMYAIIP